MNIGVIFAQKKGQTVAKDYLTVLHKQGITSYGLAVQGTDEGGNPFLETSAEHKPFDVNQLHTTLSNLKDCTVMVWAGKLVDNFDPVDDLQPFVYQEAAQNEDPVDIVACAFEGDFPNYSKPGGGHTDEQNFWETCVFPTMLEKYQASQDRDEFIQRLRSSQFEQLLLNPMAHRGVAMLLPIEGEIITVGKNELGGSFDWGITSNKFEYGAPKVTESVKAAAAAVVSHATKKVGRLAQAMGTAAVVPATNRPEAETNPSAGKDGPKEGPVPGVYTASTPTKKSDVDTKTHTVMKVPSNLQGNARNAWIRLAMNQPEGPMPTGHQSKDFQVAVPNELVAFFQEQVKTKDEVKRLASRVSKFRQSGISAQMKEAVDTPMKTEPPSVAKPEKKNNEERPVQDYLPEITADEKSASMELVHDFATRGNAPSMSDIQRIESKWPRFHEMYGIKVEDMLRWSIADKKAFAKKHPNAFALAFTELQLMVLETGAYQMELNTEKQNDAGNEKKQVEVPPTQPQPSPSQVPAQPAAKRTGRLARAMGNAA